MKGRFALVFAVPERLPRTLLNCGLSGRRNPGVELRPVPSVDIRIPVNWGLLNRLNASARTSTLARSGTEKRFTSDTSTLRVSPRRIVDRALENVPGAPITNCAAGPRRETRPSDPRCSRAERLRYRAAEQRDERATRICDRPHHRQICHNIPQRAAGAGQHRSDVDDRRDGGAVFPVPRTCSIRFPKARSSGLPVAFACGSRYVDCAATCVPAVKVSEILKTR